MRKQARETASLAGVAEKISASLVLEDIVGSVYKSFRGLLPYDRIGLALVTDGGRVVRSVAVRSNARKLHIPPGYSALLKGSSLANMLKTGRPRIINDLQEYLSGHPQSDPTRRIVAEGLRSSLTCPLIARGKPVGFIFFSSRKSGTYSAAHVASFRRIAVLLSLAVEKACLYKKLEEADQMKTRLMGVVAHDLNNPLAIVTGYLTLMLEAPGGGAFKQELDIARRNCKHMASIIENILDSHIIQTGALELNRESLDLREFLGHICSDNRILAEAKGIKLKLELPPALPEMTADRSRLLQVFGNLLSNAIKYSPPKTTIALSARVVAHAVEISVADQGQGIPAKEFPLLFKEFGRASVRPTDGERSIGLGLSIAQRMVKAHGGAIRVESEPGAGTTFTVSLPLRAASGGCGLWT